MERIRIEDVQTAVGDMVDLIKTYRSKRRLSQVIAPTIMEPIIDRAISDLKVSYFRRVISTPRAADESSCQRVGRVW